MTSDGEELVTPKMQAEFLEKYATCLGVVGDDKYYVYEPEAPAKGFEKLNEKVFRVTFVNGKPVLVITLARDVAETIINGYKLKFGEF